MVTLGPQALNTATKEAELHAELGQQAEIEEPQGLERGDESAKIVLPAGMAREGEGAHPVVCERGAPRQHALAVRGLVQTVLVYESRIFENRAHLVADLAMSAIEQLSEFCHDEPRRCLFGWRHGNRDGNEFL